MGLGVWEVQGVDVAVVRGVREVDGESFELLLWRGERVKVFEADAEPLRLGLGLVHGVGGELREPVLQKDGDGDTLGEKETVIEVLGEGDWLGEGVSEIERGGLREGSVLGLVEIDGGSLVGVTRTEEVTEMEILGEPEGERVACDDLDADGQEVTEAVPLTLFDAEGDLLDEGLTAADLLGDAEWETEVLTEGLFEKLPDCVQRRDSEGLEEEVKVTLLDPEVEGVAPREGLFEGQPEEEGVLRELNETTGLEVEEDEGNTLEDTLGELDTLSLPLLDFEGATL